LSKDHLPEKPLENWGPKWVSMKVNMDVLKIGVW